MIKNIYRIKKDTFERPDRQKETKQQAEDYVLKVKKGQPKERKNWKVFRKNFPDRVEIIEVEPNEAAKFIAEGFTNA